MAKKLLNNQSVKENYKIKIKIFTKSECQIKKLFPDCKMKTRNSQINETTSLELLVALHDDEDSFNYANK